MGTDASQNPGCLGSLLRLFGIGIEVPAPDQTLPYRQRDDFLSAAELSFYRALSAAVGTKTHVCPKVNLADLFFVAKPNENQGARGRISQKHVDFVLCDPESMRPLAGVELDDSSHARADRQTRDELVNGVFAAAGLPLIRIPAAASYNPADIALKVAAHLSANLKAAQPPASAVTPDLNVGTPSCPKCGVPMVLRTASRGDRKGEQFYGCSNYPKCKETKPLG
ncbi:MAG: DUF2726 domain-containing protein [Coriobacteriia bacterium]|nr:DUF2726 domain-containing protein [Coriobacteriia bacterium]